MPPPQRVCVEGPGRGGGALVLALRRLRSHDIPTIVQQQYTKVGSLGGLLCKSTYRYALLVHRRDLDLIDHSPSPSVKDECTAIN